MTQIRSMRRHSSSVGPMKGRRRPADAGSSALGLLVLLLLLLGALWFFFGGGSEGSEEPGLSSAASEYDEAYDEDDLYEEDSDLDEEEEIPLEGAISGTVNELHERERQHQERVRQYQKIP